jgi:ferric-dicitrate binding protein FerR (iron transport regulator)
MYPGPYGYAPPPQRSWRQWQAYARAHLDAGKPVESLLAEMAAAGLSQPDASRILHEVARAMRKRAWLMLGWGVVSIVIGLVLAMISLRARGSTTYFWWFGAALVGLVGVVRGIYELYRAPDL